MNEQFNFRCKFCDKQYVREKSYHEHTCTQMIRFNQSSTAIGMSAWSNYKAWMKTNHRMIPKHEMFLTSSYYTSFIKFAEFVRKVQMPNVDSFIKLMYEKDITPKLWTRDEVYAMYIEYIDLRSSPIELARISVKTLLDMADAAGCDVTDVFDFVESGDIISLFHQRRLTPWLMLFSSKFAKWCSESITPESLIVLETIIRPNYWKSRFIKRPDDVELMKKYIKHLGL